MAFRIAIINDLGDYDPKVNPADTLSADYARDLITKAQATFDSDPREAYKDVREAVDVLRKMSRTGGRALKTRHDSSPKNG
ncbi:MAG: hypothetical protein ABSD99_06950 [Candidatus Bathyarchaeia archaeon]